MIQVSEQRLQTVCLVFITAVMASFSAYWLRPVLLPFVVAVFIVSGVSPILEAIQKSVASTRLVAAVIAFLAGCVLVAVLMTALWASLVDLSQHAGAYQVRVIELVDDVKNLFSFLEVGEPTISDSEKSLADEGREKPTIQQPGLSEPERMHQFVNRTLKAAFLRLSQVFLELFSTSMIVLIYVFFLLLGTPAETSDSQTWRGIDEQIRSYLSLKTVISLATGIAFGLALWLFGIPMATAFGMLAFLLNFIPNIGPVIASLLPLPLILLDPNGSLFWMVSVITVTCGIQIVSGNVVEPKIMGQQSDLHPIVVLLALMFWGMMWGIVGMFLATPITAVIRIGLGKFELTRPVAELMAGRFPSHEAEVAAR